MGNWHEVSLRWRRVSRREARRIGAFVAHHLDHEGDAGGNAFPDGVDYSVDEWITSAEVHRRTLAALAPLGLRDLVVTVTGQRCGDSGCRCAKGPERTCWEWGHEWDPGQIVGSAAFRADLRHVRPVLDLDAEPPPVCRTCGRALDRWRCGHCDRRRRRGYPALEVS